MLTVLLDTNVLVAGIANLRHVKSPPGLIVSAWLKGAFTLVTSEYLIAELHTAFGDRYFRHRVTAQELAAAVDQLRRIAVFAADEPRVAGIAPHDADDRVISSAVNAAADYLVTGDLGLLAVDHFGGVRFVTPRVFLSILETDG